MQKSKLTDAIVARATLGPDETDVIVWDTEVSGFGLRLRPQGKSYVVVYRPAGAGRTANRKRMKLGTPATIATASEARKLALATLGRIAAGADPLADRRRARVADRAKVSDLLDRYERDLERRQYVNSKVVVGGLRSRLSGFLARDIREVTGAEYAAIIEGLEKVNKPGAAISFRRLCRAFLTYCVAKAQVLTTNPLAGHRKERATRADKIAKETHGKALTDEQLANVWRSADPSTAFGRLIRFYILTGCRRGEGAGLTWAMVDRKGGVINLPAVFTKQGRGHVVPITPTLAEVLDTCPIDARSDLVFASPRSGTKISGYTQLLSKCVQAADVDFTFHDLRRTFRTGLSRLRVNNDIAELALGHARGDLEQIYNRDDGQKELCRAFDLWSDHVVEISKGNPDILSGGARPDKMSGREPNVFD